MLILIDMNTLRMVASAGNMKLMNLVQKWDFPHVNGKVVDSESGREWTSIDEDQMGLLYTNMSGQPAPSYQACIDQLRSYAQSWPEYPKPLSYFEDLEAQQTTSQPVTTEEAKAAQGMPSGGLNSEGEAVVGEPEPEGPFYWLHPESDSCGFVETRAELEQMMQSDPNVEEIDKERYEDLTDDSAGNPSAGLTVGGRLDIEEAIRADQNDHTPISRATHQAIISGVEKANAAMTPEQKEAAKASAPTKPEKAKSAEPSAPRKPGATKMVWDIADARLAENPGLDLKMLRKLIVAECESQGINVGTAATQFGKWKAARGK